MSPVNRSLALYNKLANMVTGRRWVGTYVTVAHINEYIEFWYCLAHLLFWYPFFITFSPVRWRGEEGNLPVKMLTPIFSFQYGLVHHRSASVKPKQRDAGRNCYPWIS